jgi:hypothetical protein
MPASTVHAYREPDLAEAAYAHTILAFTPAGRTPFHVRVVRLAREHLLKRPPA